MSLSERDRLHSDLPSAAATDERVADRLERWRREAALVDDPSFELRLRQQGLDPARFLSLLAAPPPSAADQPWAKAFDAALSEPSHGDSLPLEDVDEMVFLKVVRPWLDDGWRRLLHRLAALKIRSATFARLWAQPLPAQLSAMVTRTLVLELYVHRLEGALDGATPEARFASFVARYRGGGGARGLWARYPVLARSLGERVAQWVAIGVELAGRLAADRAQLEESFGVSGDLLDLESGLGDRHAGGRTVVVLTFSTARVVYKPRSLGIDVVFRQLVSWLGEQGVEPRMRPLEVLDRGSYGWMEHVAHAPCADSAAVRRFYLRQGVHLALLYALQGTDFHYENLIAADEHPVLIDLETLFEPVFAVPGEARNPTTCTVLRNGLLPRPAWGQPGGEAPDLSGLGANLRDPMTVRKLSRVGTDEMGYVEQRAAAPPSHHRPSLDGKPVEPWPWVEAILEGFSHAYHKLVELRPAFLEPGGWLERFAGTETRVIFRPTGLYARLLHLAEHPDHLQDGLDRDRLYDKLWLDAELLDHVASAIPAEREALWRGDVPRFHARTDSRDVWTCSGERLPELLPHTGLEAVRDRLVAMGEDDLERQLSIARLALAVTRPREAGPRARAESPTAPVTEGDDFRRMAVRLADRLETLAVPHDGRLSWFHLQGGRERSFVEVVGSDLYGGTAGIAIFFGVLGAHGPRSSGERAGELARRTLAATRDRIRKQPGFAKNIGGYDGLGGWLYTLTYLGTLWGEMPLLDEAETVRDRIADRVDADEGLDVIAGSAGAIGALLALYGHRPSPETLKAAVACGEHLLGRLDFHERDEAGALPRGGQRPLTGFAHGAAGIAWALARLAVVTGRQDFARGARSGLTYERGWFSLERDNWMDVREERREGGEWGAQNAWCHGAPGIGLSRLDLLERWSGDVLSRAARVEEVRAAIRSTRRNGFDHNHCLCHGDLGNLELLTRASRVLGDEDLADEARGLAGRILAGIEQDGPRCGITSPVELPGLLTGLAGVGYGLLRLAVPDLPSVLLLETPGSSAPHPPNTHSA